MPETERRPIAFQNHKDHEKAHILCAQANSIKPYCAVVTAHNANIRVVNFLGHSNGTLDNILLKIFTQKGRV